MQSFPMQQLCKQSYLVLPGNRNSLASILSRKIGGRNTDYFSHLLNTLRPPRNRGFQLCFAVTKHTRRRSSKIWNQKRFSEAEFKRLGFLSTVLALLSYISRDHCPRPLRRFERNCELTKKGFFFCFHIISSQRVPLSTAVTVNQKMSLT